MFHISDILLRHQFISSHINKVLLIEPSSSPSSVEFLHLPLGNEFIIINFKNEITYSLMPENERRRLRSEGAYLVGKAKNNRKFHIKLTHPVYLIMFNPCTFYLFSNRNVSDYLNRIINFDCPLTDTPLEAIERELNQMIEVHFNPLKLRELQHHNLFEIMKYVETSAGTVSVQSIVNQFKLSEATLYRVFKKYMGLNLRTYIRHVRLKGMLKTIYRGDYNALSSIESGFFDQSHFIREFKKHYRVTPLHFLNDLNDTFKNDTASRHLFERCYIND